ncbi:MAG: L-threonylcarbamoyladenylate synthase [Pseudonocardiales bacterium]|nr:L-threonylcarbamoyladenylate synthase [Pseudonocardiales bacterium]
MGEDGGVLQMYDCADPDARLVGLAAATASVAAGELVVLPTDTVYGIGADAFTSTAVAALLQAKGRGRDMPVPVLVGSWATVDGLVSVVTASTRQLIEAFWPGGLTLVVRHAPSLSWDLGDAAGTVAIRMPLHPVAVELLERTGPMAVSSANLSGLPPARTAAEARDQLGDSVAVYLEDGPVTTGLPSTIVDMTGERPRILRAGAVGVDELREVVADIVDATTVAADSADAGTPQAGNADPTPTSS